MCFKKYNYATLSTVLFVMRLLLPRWDATQSIFLLITNTSVHVLIIIISVSIRKIILALWLYADKHMNSIE